MGILHIFWHLLCFENIGNLPLFIVPVLPTEFFPGISGWCYVIYYHVNVILRIINKNMTWSMTYTETCIYSDHQIHYVISVA